MTQDFCIDIRGHKFTNIDRGLQAHACYSYQGKISPDQGFVLQLTKNQFILPFFNVCRSFITKSISKFKFSKCNRNKLQTLSGLMKTRSA